MPDIIDVFARRWKLILGLTLLSAVVALVASLLSPKEYLSVATALPANSVVADKARIFNSNIEALYSDFGTPDELDRLEGTAVLDTLYIAAVNAHNLPVHYGMTASGEGVFKAVMRLKKHSKISRSAYGELKVRVWDEDRNMAAALANYLMKKLQELHQHLQNENSLAVLRSIEAEYKMKLQQYEGLTGAGMDTSVISSAAAQSFAITALRDQIGQYQSMMNQYQLAVKTNPQVLLEVEPARPALWPDKPRKTQIVLLCTFGAFVFAFLLALFAESRRQ